MSFRTPDLNLAYEDDCSHDIVYTRRSRLGKNKQEQVENTAALSPKSSALNNSIVPDVGQSSANCQKKEILVYSRRKPGEKNETLEFLNGIHSETNAEEKVEDKTTKQGN